MSWVCSYCSSNNEDGVSVCFVCGTERSAEEIRAAKLEKRKRLAEAKTIKRRKLFAKIESGTLSVHQLLKRKGKPWQARAKYKDVYRKWYIKCFI